MAMTITNYHKSRTTVDFNFIRLVFDGDRRKSLYDAQDRQKHSIIRFNDGSGGSVPSEHDGSIIYIAGI